MDFEFRINGSFTPETIPMSRLAEYMLRLSDLFKNDDKVHFSSISTGSVRLKARVELDASEKVRGRLYSLKSGQASKSLSRTFNIIDAMLAEDAASGELTEVSTDDRSTSAEIINFPGVKPYEQVLLGPFVDEGSLEGQLIQIGGRDDSVPTFLEQTDGEILNCDATRDMARQLGPHLFGSVLRVYGVGHWLRTESGQWRLEKRKGRKFTITKFEPLQEQSLVTDIQNLQSVKGSGWSKLQDPNSELRRLRAADEVL